MSNQYDPLQFIYEANVLTVAMVGSFITLKLLNSFYDNLYEPFIDLIIDTKESEKYYLKIGEYFIQVNMIFKEIIKWIILISILMIVYNIFIKKQN